ncbi:hypothetical protein ACTXT7_000472 [Hymenolepis weldensis]
MKTGHLILCNGQFCFYRKMHFMSQGFKALRLENEKILAEEKAEKERQKALKAKEAAITEATQLIATYASAFLTRRAAVTKSKSKGRR